MPGFMPRSFNDALRTREEGKTFSRGLEGPTTGGAALGAKMTAARWKRQGTGTSPTVPPKFAEEIQQNPGHHETWLKLFRGTADGAAFGPPPEAMNSQPAKQEVA